jgi:hypothetical protein
VHLETALIDETDAIKSVEYPDYFAELYVAGLMADAGWNVYFPHRDRGLDFIACKTGADRHQIIRPVQVKGKYPLRDKTDKATYGFVGRLNQIHQDMVLAIPFFADITVGPPLFVAFMPFSAIKSHKRGYRCQPACFAAGRPSPRRDSLKYIDRAGLDLIERGDWGTGSNPNHAL